MIRFKILDCTLRDGGYINNWNFGKNNIIKIINNLQDSKIDIIEVGFLDDNVPYTEDSTTFNNIDQIDNILKECNCAPAGKVAMVMLGKCKLENIKEKNESNIDGIRVCFKKNQIDEAIEYCKSLIQKGYDVYLQPAAITDYTDLDIIDLVMKSNKLEKIKAFYIVDTYGLMHKDEVVRYYYLIDSNLNDNVAIGFHSHNNLQLSFSNSQALLEINKKRDLYIDSSVFGMGRGAGNLCSELITSYINSNYDGKYELVPILELVDDCIMPIFKVSPWGYSVAFYVASINKCHPNYATFLTNKQTIGVTDINVILKKIPENRKRNYDEKLILEMYTNYLNHKFDDYDNLEKLKNIISNRNILVIAPGKTVKEEENNIKEYIEKNKPYTISINFIPENINIDSIFVSNLRRYRDLKLDNQTLLYTSNISVNAEREHNYKFNYESYLNEEELVSDNATLMLINILLKIGYNDISLAGFDGYSVTESNYYDDRFKPNMDNETLILINKKISEYLKTSGTLKCIKFLTKTNYDIE